jgi:integrase
MAARKLTDRFVESVKPTPGKQAAYPDTDPKGLELRVSPEGRKVWSLRYRTAEGIQRRLTLGVYPATDLKGARTEATKELGKVAAGVDPAGEVRAKKRRYAAEPMKTVADLGAVYFSASERGEWRPRGKRKRESSIKAEKSIWKNHILPRLGDERVEAVTKATVRAFLRGMADAGLTARVNRAQAVVSQMFAFAISEDRVASNPTAGLTAIIDEKPRERVLNDEELKAIWGRLADPAPLHLPSDHPLARHGTTAQVGRGPRLAALLCALLLQRRGEIAGMAVAELDLVRGVWTIPPDRMKSGRAHIVPLPAKAIELIKRALAARKFSDSPYVFPGRYKKDQPLAPLSVARGLSLVCAAAGIEDVGLHDLRRTGASALTSERLGVRRFMVSHVLGHAATDGAAITAVYDRHDYMPEKRQALEAWEGLLLEIVGERERADNVTALRA